MDNMKKRGFLLLILVVAIAFWQVFFLTNGMKWDFVDAFLPSRYFFSESILNNQFPLWNPYLLYGTPIYADLVSVFNPEFWIIGNMFGYSNITLQYVFLAYILVAGISFFYFLKQFNSEYKFSAGLSIAYMLSGFTIGNAQHLAFISGYALLPFLIASYFKFFDEINKTSLVRLSIALFLMIYCSYPALTIISGYFMFSIFIYYLAANWIDKKYIRKLFIYHIVLLLIVILFSTTLVLAYIQVSPFLGRFAGLPTDLAQKHPFSLKSVLSFLLPMATGVDVEYFETDVSISNGYWGIFSLVFFFFILTKKAIHKVSYLILLFGVFSLLASFGDQFFLREFLYKFAPFMDRFQYPGIFRAFTIFCFLAFAGINFDADKLKPANRKRIILISAFIISLLLFFVWQANSSIEQFAYFNSETNFTEDLFLSTRFDNIVLQGVVQIIFLLIFILITWKIKETKYFSTALLFLFIADGIVNTQLSIHYTVIGKTNPIKFFEYLQSSPKGFPVPALNPVGENSDKNAANQFTWINNNVFPKKVTFDGLVSFKIDGYKFLSDNHPDLLESIKKEAIVYFSDDIRKDSIVQDFKTNTIFLQATEYNNLFEKNLRSSKYDNLEITDFSPSKIEIQTNTNSPQLLTYQQNFYTGWKVYVDGKQENLIKSNFAHMSVFLPPGEHTVLFEYKNNAIIYTFLFTVLIFSILIYIAFKNYIDRHPNKKKQAIFILGFGISVFILVSSTNRYIYKKNKLGLAPVIIEKVEKWKNVYNDDISILLSTQQKEMKNLVDADELCFINERNNVSELSLFLMNSESRFFAFAWQGGIIGDELFELIYSFYPKIIELEKSNNSGIVLLEKGNLEQDYNLIRTFEPDGSEEWFQNSARIKVDSVNGNHTYYYGENDEFGTSIEIPVAEDLIGLDKITVLADFMIEEKKSEILLVFTTMRAEKLQVYQVSKINEFAKYPNIWNRAVFDVNVKSELEEGDFIKIYFWNLTRANFQIDNLKIKYSNS